MSLINLLGQDLGKVLLQLEFQTAVNTEILQRVINMVEGDAFSAGNMEAIKLATSEAINKRYGTEVITYRAPATVSATATPVSESTAPTADAPVTADASTTEPATPTDQAPAADTTTATATTDTATPALQ